MCINIKISLARLPQWFVCLFIMCAEAPAGTIRGDLGENMMINVCHASDGPEAAATELKRFFGDDEIFAY